MFEFVRTLVEAVPKAIPAGKRLNEIGASLVLLYIRINETLVTGERIADILELYLRQAQEGIDKGDDDHFLKVGRQAQRDLEYPLDQQRINLAAVCTDIRQKNLHESLNNLLWGEQSAVNVILRVLAQRALPLSPTDREIAEATDPELVIDWWESWADPVIARTSASITRRVVPTSEPWDREVFQILADYVEQQNPREQLARSWEALARIRSAFEDQVTVADVLATLAKAERRPLYDGYKFGP